MLKPIHLLSFLFACFSANAQAEDSVITIESAVAVPEIIETSMSGGNYSFNPNNSYTYSANAQITIYIIDFSSKVDNLKRFLNAHDIKMGSSSQSNYHFSTSFEIKNKQYDSVYSFLNSMGYITNSNYNTANLDDAIRTANRTIEQNKLSIQNYKARIAQLGEGKSDEILNLKNQILNFENRIEEEEYKLKIIERNKEYTYFSIDVYDENSSPDGRNSRISWVRMPGISVQYLTLENPKAQFSAKAYQGASLKYLFTKGKSYLEIGVLKSVKNPFLHEIPTTQDSQMYNEFFMISFGQDFYARNFGRGNRRWFNLYSGYQIGLTIPNRFNDLPANSFAYTNLNVGLEIYKSKRILVDTRASYFLPLYEFNRNTRGIMTTASFNFVF